MFIADRFVYLHFPKTGGSFVSAALRRIHSRGPWPSRRPRGRELLVPNLKKIRGAGALHPHGTYEQIPPAHRGKPVVSVIRNPFDRYVSGYEFSNWRDRPPAELEAIRGRFPAFPDLSFEEYLEFVSVFDLRNRVGSELVKADVGAMTFAFLQFFCRDPRSVFERLDDAWLDSGGPAREIPDIRFLRNERLNRDLHDFLREVGYRERDVAFIVDEGKVNVTPRREAKPWPSYYRPETFDFVRRKERFLLRLFPEYDRPPLESWAEEPRRIGPERRR